MNKIIATINNDLISSMRAKEEQKVSVLRMLIAGLKNKEIEIGKDKEKRLTEDQVLAVIKNEVKKRKDSIELYKQGQRKDLAQKEEEEIKIIKKYLPPELNDKEIAKAVEEVTNNFEDATMNDFGQVMGQVMSKLKGQADGTKVSAVVKKKLSS